MSLAQHDVALSSLALIDGSVAEQISGGQADQPSPDALTETSARRPRRRARRVEANFYQINIVFNFIFGGSNNSIVTMQGNEMGMITFKALGGPLA